MQDGVYTIGHSTHSLEQFIALLRQHGITAVGDVRSKPFSRYNPQFNREQLERTLQERGIVYRFLGEELGARSDDPACYEGGKVQYDRLAKTRVFRSGVERVRNGMKSYWIALMCAEKEPLECHRTILVARQLVARGIGVQHILADGSLESHEAALERLALQLNLPESDLFRSHEDVLEDAYRLQGNRIAYERGQDESQSEEG